MYLNESLRDCEGLLLFPSKGRGYLYFSSTELIAARSCSFGSSLDHGKTKLRTGIGSVDGARSDPGRGYRQISLAHDLGTRVKQARGTTLRSGRSMSMNPNKYREQDQRVQTIKLNVYDVSYNIHATCAHEKCQQNTRSMLRSTDTRTGQLHVRAYETDARGRREKPEGVTAPRNARRLRCAPLGDDVCDHLCTSPAAARHCHAPLRTEDRCPKPAAARLLRCQAPRLLGMRVSLTPAHDRMTTKGGYASRVPALPSPRTSGKEDYVGSAPRGGVRNEGGCWERRTRRARDAEEERKVKSIK
ncbi:hypothetical protein B0H17DRAFT_1149187 [Mycena rosella]|uniref:Uncharacterized protein n=1 Tax=Mycena rosella TaxID=1033263 RepID=A0AAD7C647_MYCRO|nr:hypothetical protein B0H17DRAFT_1149187 [Mycena rosella]